MKLPILPYIANVKNDQSSTSTLPYAIMEWAGIVFICVLGGRQPEARNFINYRTECLELTARLPTEETWIFPHAHSHSHAHLHSHTGHSVDHYCDFWSWRLLINCEVHKYVWSDFCIISVTFAQQVAFVGDINSRKCECFQNKRVVPGKCLDLMKWLPVDPADDV